MDLEIVWKKPPSEITFKTMDVGTPFHLEESHIIISGYDGKVTFFSLFSESQVLANLILILIFKIEGFSLINSNKSPTQCILLCEMVKSRTDLIIGDNEGNVNVFSNGQILSHHQIGMPITDMCISYSPCMIKLKLN